MKLQSIVFASALLSTNVFAAPAGFKGSDTLAGAITDAIIASGLESKLQYLGTGSGNGEKALVAGEQGIAPLSRAIKSEAVEALKAKNIEVIAHKIALDGIAVFAKADADAPLNLDIPTIVKIFNCEIVKWEEISGSKKTGPIAVFRRNDASGTTDAFKQFTGIKTFGSCVTVLEETTDIANETSTNQQAIAYAGLSAKTPQNKIFGLSAVANGAPFTPTVANIRSGKYPFSRALYVYEAAGKTSDAEKELLDSVTDRSFMDKIVTANQFFTID